MTYPEDHIDEWRRGQGLWEGVPKQDWEDWRWQLNHRIQKLDDLRSYLSLTSDEEKGCLAAGNKLLFAITPYFFNLIDRNDPNCPIRKQVIPQVQEMETAPEELLDPVGEDRYMPLPGLVHAYPDRVLFLVTSFCASYCRYCTRSRLVSNAQGYNFHPRYDDAIAYISANKAIRDVLISGGDPLLLSDSVLDRLLTRLRAIPHVEFIRIGSRVPVFMPQRITEGLTAVLKKHGPIWMSLHVNHPRECTLELKEACKKLICSWSILGCQTVLLRGVNDEATTIRSLCHRLLQMGVRPYYLFQSDLITGSAHLRTDVKKGLEIIESLRGHTTGYAVPQLVVEAPGGGGKVILHPKTIEAITDKEIIVRNFRGQIASYPLSPTKLLASNCSG